ncbi:hypothetical protein KY495_18430 [Massilia sp. PAMC28688]|uniref:hypothetical protein n=1 Tax=Massilia sp. PAMC28688 TaxID=2861283 RepID=UPI001C63B126|nr:hypothetical protein [Massilia sp. PAMC28688]QYF92692.1 hypothetical protein KY495_18430 [Massilia sp. PAMC28688]
MKTVPLIMLALTLAACSRQEAANPLDSVARRTCMDTIESRATNRDSVAYGDDMPVERSKPDGQMNVTVKFSAKNEIGMASNIVANCVVSADGKTLVSIATKEGR